MEKRSYSATGIGLARHIKAKGVKSFSFRMSMTMPELVLILVGDGEEVCYMGWRSGVLYRRH